MRTHTRTHTWAHAHPHMHTCTHAHTHVHTRAQQGLFSMRSMRPWHACRVHGTQHRALCTRGPAGLSVRGGSELGHGRLTVDPRPPRMALHSRPAFTGRGHVSRGNSVVAATHGKPFSCSRCPTPVPPPGVAPPAPPGLATPRPACTRLCHIPTGAPPSWGQSDPAAPALPAPALPHTAGPSWLSAALR